MFGNLIVGEIQKLGNQIASFTGLKNQLYEKADALLVEIETVPAEELKLWVEQKRIELRQWCGK